MTVYQQVQSKVLASLKKLYAHDQLDTSKLVIEPSKDTTHGDIATNAALVLSKQLKTPPKVIAEQVIDELKSDGYFTKIESAGPGFINFMLNEQAWRNELFYILSHDGCYDFLSFGKNKKINIEFVSANPTGPLHTGHGRNAVLGDTIANLLEKVGFDVTREYYINDAGGQIKILVQSVYLRYREVCSDEVKQEEYEGKYPGTYLIPIAQEIFNKHNNSFLEKPTEQWFEIFRKTSVDSIMQLIKHDLSDVGINMDVYTSEKKLTENGDIDRVLQELKDDIFTGVLEKPKGHDVEDWEERPQTLFRATKYGDDTDRALKKSDGSWTYFAGDLGYHLNKLDRRYDRLINLFGADHIGYIKRIKSAVSALSKGKIDLEIKASQLVNFLENGKPLRMSKRTGNFITLKDVVDRVGKDATRFMMLSRHQDMKIDFDFKKVIEASKDNPIFYIHYAHARIKSVLRKADSLNIDSSNITMEELGTLKNKNDIALVKMLAQWPRELEVSAKTLEPHRICNFLYTLSSEFHAFWNLGKTDPSMRFIDENNLNLTRTRLNLISAIAITISSGLELLGITALEEM